MTAPVCTSSARPPGCRQCRELPAGPADAAMPRRVCIMPRRSCCYVSLSRGLLTASLSIIVLDWYCCRRMAALPSVQCGAEGEYHTRPLSYMHNSTAHATPADLIVPREPPAETPHLWPELIRLHVGTASLNPHPDELSHGW